MGITSKVALGVIIGILSAIVIIAVVLLAIFFVATSDVREAISEITQTAPGVGTLGDEHEHASILVRIFGDRFDFSLPAYQIQTSWIHFEGQDGTTVHRHSSGVTLGYLFETFGIVIDENCYIFPDGRQFCANDEYSIKYFINHQPVESINDHVLKEGDRILISYGNENQEQIDAQLSELDVQPILG